MGHRCGLKTKQRKQEKMLISLFCWISSIISASIIYFFTIKKTEDDLAFMRDKKGISYSAKFTQVREKIQKHYNSLFENKQ